MTIFVNIEIYLRLLANKNENEKENKNKKEGIITRLWLLPGNILTIVSIIVLPLVVVISHIVVFDVVINYYQNNVTPANAPVIHNKIQFIAEAVFAFTIGAYIIILVIYPPYPAPYPAEKYFLDRGANAVYDYENAKRILYICLPIFLLLFIVNYNQQFILPIIRYAHIFNMNESILIVDNLEAIKSDDNFKYAYNFFGLIIIAGILKITFALVRKEFKLYFARGCFKIISDKFTRIEDKNEVEEMKYVIMGLNAYNSYLRRHLKLQIKDLKEVYSKIATSPIKKREKDINSISETIRGSDTLEPIKYLAELLALKKKSELLVEVPIRIQIKDLITYASIVIPIIITLVRLSPWLCNGILECK